MMHKYGYLIGIFFFNSTGTQSLEMDWENHSILKYDFYAIIFSFDTN